MTLLSMGFGANAINFTLPNSYGRTSVGNAENKVQR